MKILLLNNNPVVNKLVTLSTQKTSDELDVVDNLDDIESNKYDLLVIDDTLYSEDIMQELNSKIEFNKSLYICAKDAEMADGFTSILKKPFLPTDLVELFVSLASDTDTIELDDVNKEELDEVKVNEDDFDELDSLDDEVEEVDNIDDDINDFDELDSLDDEVKLDEVEAIDEPEELEEVSLESDAESEEVSELDEELEEVESSEDIADTILDKEDLQEVQDLLEETEEVSLESAGE
ncbi:MAG: DNA topoisomerase IV, partial [Sulfurimonas sp.]|nr:DNA topoisomerase IV [Sulfurimonas sp.]